MGIATLEYQKVVASKMVPPINVGAYTLKDDIERFGTSGKDAVIGEVHCIGTESGLLECSHSSIGFHYCSPYYLDYDEPDIVISCYGMYGCACISGINVSNLDTEVSVKY